MKNNKREKFIEENKEYFEALTDTLIIGALTTFPSIFLVIRSLFDKSIKNHDIIFEGGVFFLYGVSFLGSAYLVYKHYKNSNKVLLDLFSSIVIFLIIIFSISYTAIFNLDKSNFNNIKYGSIIAITISIPFFYYSQVISNKNKPSMDVGEKRKKEQQTILDGLK